METVITTGNTSVPANLPSIDGHVSLVGDFVSYDKGSKIRKWIEDTDAIDHIISGNSMLLGPGTELQSVISSEESRYGRVDGTTMRGSDTETVNLKTPDQDPLFGDDDFDMDDDFFVEAANSALQKGKSAFAVNDYKSADALLREALTMLMELAGKQQAPPDTWELRRTLGICAFHVHTPAEAEDALLSVLQHAPKNAILGEAERLQVSETAHLLAQVYVKLGKLDKAYRYCEYALRGRRKILGKNNGESYESLALTARILELQGNEIRAEFFVDMIPQDERETYVKKYGELALPKEVTPIEDEGQLLENRPMKTTPPASSRKVISPGGSPPKIPERSASRGLSGTPPRSRSGTLQGGSHLRTMSSLSGPVSALSSEPGDVTSRPSVSPLKSPEIGKTTAAETAVSADAVRSVSQDLPPIQQKPIPETPAPTHTNSGQSAVSDIPTVDEPKAIQSQTSGSPQPRGLLPEPLRTQRTYVFELPGDTHFGNLSQSKGSSPTLPQSMPIPKVLDYAAKDGKLTAFPSFPLPIEPPLAALPAKSPNLNLQDRSVSAPVVPQVPQSGDPRPYVPCKPYVARIRPVDCQSIASSTYSESISTSDSRSTADFMWSIAPDAVPEFRNAKLPERKRKISLLSKLRKNNSTSNSASLYATRSESIRYNGVRLSKKDIDSIKNDWLTDDVIDFWQEYLEHEMLNHSPKFVLMRPVRASLLLREAENPASLKAALPDFTNTLHVMMPLKSPQSSHCSLLLISAQDGVACHYDPSSPRNRQLAETVSQQISAHLNKKLEFLDVPGTPSQSRDQDCGVFVCFFMQHLIAKINTTHVSEKVDASLAFRMDAKRGRKAILKAIEARKKSQALIEE